jgi:hypothetical protein
MLSEKGRTADILRPVQLVVYGASLDFDEVGLLDTLTWNCVDNRYLGVISLERKVSRSQNARMESSSFLLSASFAAADKQN